MKVIKRDGRVVDFDREKIIIAIDKANKEVSDKERASKKDIKDIIKFIEQMDKKRILVEDIQDVIEERLMDKKKFKLAKKYMIYRYNRALVRKKNTTDESILGLIKNPRKNKEESYENAVLASKQRDYIAGEVSKDLTKRILLPEKIVKAHEEGILCFQDMKYFLQPIINSSFVNVEKLLDEGTIINKKYIESPKSFRVACIVMTQIIATIASTQYGEQVIDISALGKYLRKSYEKFREEIKEDFKDKLNEEEKESLVNKKIKEELVSGVQSIKYQINTLMTTNGHNPIVSFVLCLDENDEYIKENALIIEEILNQRLLGMKDENKEQVNPKFPRLIYILENNNIVESDKYYYLTKLAIKASKKTLEPSFVSLKKIKEDYSGNIFCSMNWKNNIFKKEKQKYNVKFNQGIVSINLVQIAIIAEKNEKDFFDLLEERLELCYEALMCRHYSLLGTISNTSPIHWINGAIANLDSEENIDKYLKNCNSTLLLGYVGLIEAVKLLNETDKLEDKENNLAIKIVKKLKEKVESWRKQTDLGFSLYGEIEDKVCRKLYEIDKEKYGVIKGIKNKYVSSYYLDNEKMETKDRLLMEAKLQEISKTEGKLKIKSSEIKDDEEFIDFVYNNIEQIKCIR